MKLLEDPECACDRRVLHLQVNTNVHSLPAVSDRGKVQRPGKASQRDSAKFPTAPDSEKTRWRNPPSSSEIPARWQGAWMDGYALVACSDSGHTQVRGYLNSRWDSGPHWEWMHATEKYSDPRELTLISHNTNLAHTKWIICIECRVNMFMHTCLQTRMF